MDRFRELKAFIAVVEAGGFSAAARKTGEPQPAISKAVSALEKRLALLLFNRSTRRATLTDQGQRYYDLTKSIISEIDQADNEVIKRVSDVSGLIRIAAPSTLGRLHVLPLIPELLSRNPGLKIDLILSDSVRDMVEDRIDLAIRGGRVNEPDAVVRHVGSTSLVCTGARRYFERHGVPKTPADLVQHNCLLYNGDAHPGRWPFAGPQGRFDVPVRGNLSSNSIETLRAGVLAGLGVGRFARSALVDEIEDSVVVTILDEYLLERRDISLVWPRRRFVPARVRHATDYFALALRPVI